MATNPASLKTAATGLVPIKFIGLPIDPAEPDGPRAGEAGLGLRVGEVRGVSPAVAARMIDAGTAVAVDPDGDKPTKPAPAK